MLRPNTGRIWLPERPETYDKYLLPGNAQVWVPRTDGYSIGIREAVNINSANGVPYQQGPLGLAIRARPNSSTDPGECAYWNFTSSPVTRGSGSPSATLVGIFACENFSYAPNISYGSDGSGNGWSMSIGLNASTITGAYVDSSPAGFTATITRTQTANRLYAVALRKVGTTLTVFCEGQTATVTGGNGALRTSSFGLCSTSAVASSGFNRTYLAAITDAALSDAQIWALLRDPRRLFPAARRRVWVTGVAAGGGAINGVVANAASATSGSAPAATQAQQASIAAGVTATTASTPAATQSHVGAAAASVTATVGSTPAATQVQVGQAAAGSTATVGSNVGAGESTGAVDPGVTTTEASSPAGTQTGPGLPTPGGYDAGHVAQRAARRKQTVLHSDDRDRLKAEFDALLARVKGQAVEKAASAADQSAPDSSAPTQDIKPPRMPEVRGVAPELLRQWMPDLLATFRTEYRNAYLDQVAQAAKRRAEFAAIAEEEAILIVATL